MKVKVKSSEINKAMKLCANAIDPKDPIRSNINFVVEGENITLSATNGQYSIEVVAKGDIQEEGTAIVDGKMAYNVISKSTGDCLFTTDGKSMTIKTSGKTRLPNIDHDLPVIEAPNGEVNSVTFDSIEFKNAINKISYAIAEDESRVVLTGAHIVTKDGVVAEITALDGFRLAQTSLPCVGSMENQIDIIVPAKILNAICDAVTDGDIELLTNGSKITVRGENFKINAITLSGTFIDTEKIIPTSFKTKVLVKTADIKNCADSATVASGTNNLVKLVIENDNVAIMSNSDVADFHGDVSALIEGDNIVISFNIKYLIQAFNHISTEECELLFNQSVSPAIIKPHEENNADISLLLPVRTFT